MGAAIDSLNPDDKDKFDAACKAVANYSYLRNKLNNLEKSSITYKKLKRIFLDGDMNPLPSTQDLLTHFSEKVYLSSCDYSYPVQYSDFKGFIESF
jgi:hypothetical protein